MAETTVTLTIDGKQVEVPAGTSILQAAKSVDIEIPHFCYHPKLSIVASCRLCLVEIEGAPKLVTSCSTPAVEGTVVRTDTKKVKDAREDMMAMFLTSHPLDCPVCDKGGECPLQNYTYMYGPGKSLFVENKWRFEKPVDIGRHILIDRERCVMCTRCVRFQEEIAGHPELGIFGRNKGSYIGPHPDRPFDSNYSGNTTELCPVGALTTKEFRFQARPWELTRKPSVCPSCGCGCNVNLDIRQGKVMRVVSRRNPDVDDGFLCDRGRFGYASLYDENRPVAPQIRTADGLVKTGWDEAIDYTVRNLQTIRERCGSDAIAGLVSPSLTNEEIYVFSRLFREVIGTDLIGYSVADDPVMPVVPAGLPGIAPFAISDIDTADLVVLVGCDPERDLPIIDLRIKTAEKLAKARVVRLADWELQSLCCGEVGEAIGAAASPVLLVGWGCGKDVSGMLAQMGDGRQAPLRVGILHPAGNAMGAAEIIPKNRGCEIGKLVREEKIKALYVMGGEPQDPLVRECAALLTAQTGVTVIYQGVLLPPEIGAAAWVILPTAAFPEKDGTLINVEGRIQRLRKATDTPRETQDGLRVLCRIAGEFGTDFSNMSTARVVFEEMGISIERFREMTWDDIGLQGRYCHVD